MKRRSRATLIALVVLLLPIVVLVPLSKAQVARITQGALFLPKNLFSLPSRVFTGAMLGSSLTPAPGLQDQGNPRPADLKPDKALSVEAEDAETPAYEILKVSPAVFRGDVRNLPLVPQQERQRPELARPSNLKRLLPIGHQQEEPNVSLAPMPGPIQNFPGLTRDDICTGGQCGSGIPPDTNGDVGPNHYIQAVNSAYAIYDKSTGNLLASFTENSLFSGGPTGTVCDTSSFGDPVVVYDALADRWILSNFAFDVVEDNPVSPFFQCIAVSQTSSPVTGGWFLYAIRTDTGAAGQPPVNTINDYPKFGGRKLRRRRHARRGYDGKPNELHRKRGEQRASAASRDLVEHARLALRSHDAEGAVPEGWQRRIALGRPHRTELRCDRPSTVGTD